MMNGYKQILVNVPEDVHKKLKQKGLNENKPLCVVVNEILEKETRS